MSTYKGQADIIGIDWNGTEETIGGFAHTPRRIHHPLTLIIEIPAVDFAGLDLTRPITITQDHRAGSNEQGGDERG